MEESIRRISRSLPFHHFPLSSFAIVSKTDFGTKKQNANENPSWPCWRTRPRVTSALNCIIPTYMCTVPADRSYPTHSSINHNNLSSCTAAVIVIWVLAAHNHIKKVIQDQLKWISWSSPYLHLSLQPSPAFQKWTKHSMTNVQSSSPFLLLVHSITVVVDFTTCALLQFDTLTMRVMAAVAI